MTRSDRVALRQLARDARRAANDIVRATRYHETPNDVRAYLTASYDALAVIRSQVATILERSPTGDGTGTE